MDLARLIAAGFDIVHDFDPASTEIERLRDPARPRGVLVGNTRALWPKFLAARAADPALAAARDPLDTYTEREIAAAAPDAVIYYVHRRYDGAFLPFQRIAVAAGLAALAPTHLLIHPEYGPWFALRAVLLTAGHAVSRSLLTAPCRCDTACHDAFARARSAEGWQAWVAVRDACTVGRQHRYGEDQLSYHYTKNRALLR